MDKCPYGYTIPTEFFLRGAKECPFVTVDYQSDTILKEADILRKEHPAKDCRDFADAVFRHLSK